LGHLRRSFDDPVWAATASHTPKARALLSSNCCKTVKKSGRISMDSAIEAPGVDDQLFPRCPLPATWLLLKKAIPCVAKPSCMALRASSLVLPTCEKLMKGSPMLTEGCGN
jgi:hypothetical protein